MGQYLERISQGISKHLGKRPYIFKLDEPLFMQHQFQTKDGHILKGGVEKLIEKMEIISRHLINCTKFNEKAEERL